MKWPIFIFLLISSVSFIIPESEYSKKLKTPPGTVKFNDSLFIDKTEIGNVHWREFEYWLKDVAKDSISSLQNLPDTTVWITYNSSLSPYENYYYRHPAFNYYPVVGVSFEQANAYCKWRSDRVNEIFAKGPHLNPFPGKKYRYRLPTIAEWENAAEDLDSIMISMKDKRKGIVSLKNLANIYKGDTAIELKNAEVYTAQVDSYKPNKFGIVNMIGNVSEMTTDRGIAKGGNFLLPIEKCKIKSEQHYAKPQAWLGFRCVCEIVKE
ncbi:MAG: formylglycine-generating enzyme family protein [Chitinophagaceae bacterium]